MKIQRMIKDAIERAKAERTNPDTIKINRQAYNELCLEMGEKDLEEFEGLKIDIDWEVPSGNCYVYKSSTFAKKEIEDESQ